jgi:hypothetical protein
MKREWNWKGKVNFLGLNLIESYEEEKFNDFFGAWKENGYWKVKKFNVRRNLVKNLQKIKKV